MSQYEYPLREVDDGAIIGVTTSSLVAFYGSTPVTQQTVTQAATITAASAVTTCAEAIAELYTALSNHGLIST